MLKCKGIEIEIGADVLFQLANQDSSNCRFFTKTGCLVPGQDPLALYDISDRGSRGHPALDNLIEDVVSL